MIDNINNVLSTVFDLALRPVSVFGPWGILVCTSLVAAVLVLVIFKFGSNQSKMAVRKDKMIAATMELALFQDDPKAGLGAVGSVLKSAGIYFFSSMATALVAAVPVILVAAQASSYLEHRPAAPGELLVVTAHLDTSEALTERALSAESSGNIEIDAGPVRVPSLDEVSWRVKAVEPGRGWVDIAIDGKSVRKNVVVGKGTARVSAERRRGNAFTLLHPGEARIGDGMVDAVRISYARRGHWFTQFVVLTMLLAMALKRPFGVVI